MQVDIEIVGFGAEIVVADITEMDPNLLETLKTHQSDLTSLFSDQTFRIKNSIPEWHELDNLLHVQGPLLNEIEDCKIKITCNNNLVLECYPSELMDSNEEQILLFEENYLETRRRRFFLGVQNERGLVYSGKFNLKPAEAFDIDRLKLYSQELMIDDHLIGLYIHKITYDGITIDKVVSETKQRKLSFSLFNV